MAQQLILKRASASRPSEWSEDDYDVVPVGNLRSEILMVQSAQNWHRQRATERHVGSAFLLGHAAWRLWAATASLPARKASVSR